MSGPQALAGAPHHAGVAAGRALQRPSLHSSRPFPRPLPELVYTSATIATQEEGLVAAGMQAAVPAPGALGNFQSLPKPGSDGYADLAKAPDATRAALTHAACVEWLEKLPDRLRNDGWSRSNNGKHYLGNLEGKPAAWPELPNPVSVLGLEREAHALARPFFDDALGNNAWSVAEVVSAAATALPANTQRIEPMDIDEFTSRVLFKLHFGLEIDRAFAEDFRELQRGMLVLAVGLPRWVTSGWASWILRPIAGCVVGCVLGVDVAGMPRRRASLLPTLSTALKNKFGSRYTQLSPSQQKLIVSAFLDSMVLAGGQMVPTLIKSALAALYSADFKARTLPLGGVQLCENNAEKFALELVRFEPQAVQVNAFNPSPTPGKAPHEAAAVAAAAFDKAVWDDAKRFSLERAAADYANLSVAFAEPAKCPHSSQDARDCPAKSLALEMLTAYLKRFAVISGAADSEGDAATAWECSVAPNKLNIGSQQFIRGDVFTLKRRA